MGFKNSEHKTSIKKSKNVLKTISLVALASIASIGVGINNAQATENLITPTRGNDSAYVLKQISQPKDNSITLYKYNNTGITETSNYELEFSNSIAGTGETSKYYKWDTNSTTGNYSLVETTAADADITAQYSASNPSSNVYVEKDIDYGTVEGNFIGNNSTAVINSGGTISSIIGDFVDNYDRNTGAAFYHFAPYSNKYAHTGDITGDFIGNYTKNNYSSSHGGAIYADTGYGSGLNTSIGNITGDFIANYAYGEDYDVKGGAIYAEYSNLGNITGNFIGNYAETASPEAYRGGYGGAIYLDSTKVGNITGNYIGNCI